MLPYAGPNLGNWFALFPVMYNSGGACLLLIITGGGTLDILFKTICDGDTMCHAKSLTGIEWYLVFTCIALLIAQLPNLNSIAWVSLIGATTAVLYSTLIWVLSITKDRPIGISYSQSDEVKSNMEKFSDVLNALGIIALAFKGHNVILEIQVRIPNILSAFSFSSSNDNSVVIMLVIQTPPLPLSIFNNKKISFSFSKGLELHFFFWFLGKQRFMNTLFA